MDAGSELRLLQNTIMVSIIEWGLWKPDDKWGPALSPSHSEHVCFFNLVSFLWPLNAKLDKYNKQVQNLHTGSLTCGESTVTTGKAKSDPVKLYPPAKISRSSF